MHHFMIWLFGVSLITMLMFVFNDVIETFLEAASMTKRKDTKDAIKNMFMFVQFYVILLSFVCGVIVVKFLEL